MATLVSFHVRTADIQTVRDAVEEIWGDERQIAVGAANGWVGVFPDHAELGTPWREHAQRLSASADATVLALRVDGSKRIAANLYQSGESAGHVHWTNRTAPASLELVYLELGRWRDEVRGPGADDSIEAGWLNAGDVRAAIAGLLDVPNTQAVFEELLERGESDMQGWETFRARIDGEWMQLAERRWVEPAIWTPENVVPFSPLETGELDIDDLDGPILLVEGPETEVEAGATIPVSVLLIAPHPIEVQDVIVRLTGQIDEDDGIEPFDLSVEASSATRVAIDDPLTATVMLSVPRSAIPSRLVPWRIQVTAIMVDESIVTTESSLEVYAVEQTETWVGPGPSTEEANAIAVGNTSALENSALMVLPDVTVRYAEGLYTVDVVAPAPMVDPTVEEDISGPDGRFARMHVDGNLSIRFAVRPASVVHLGMLREALLGTPAYDFIVDVFSDAVGLTLLQRWDQIHRRFLAAWARLLVEEVSSGEEGVWNVLGEQVGAIMHALPEERAVIRRMVQVLMMLTDRDGTGPIDAILAAGPNGYLLEDEDAVLLSGTPTLDEVQRLLDAGDASGAIDVANAAIAMGYVDAAYYGAIGRACMDLGFAMRRDYATRIGFFEWAYPEAYQERASGLRKRMERAYRCALWLEPTADVAASLALGVKHPLEAIGAWQVACDLQPNEPRWRVEMAAASIKVDAVHPETVIELLDAMVSETTQRDAGPLWLQATITRALALLSGAFEGGDPGFYHFGLVGEPTPVTLSGESRGPLAAMLERLEADAGDADTEQAQSARWLHQQLETLLSLEGGSDGSVSLQVGTILAGIAQRWDIERLGRVARAIALRGRYTERDVERLIARARVCQMVYASRDADELLETARSFASRSMLPVLDAKLEFLRARGADKAAMQLEGRLLRIAPEHSRRAETLFAALIEHGELGMAEELFVFYLREVPGSSIVIERLVSWAEQLAMVYDALADPGRAVRPIEWLLFLVELDEDVVARLRQVRDAIGNTNVTYWSDEGLEQ